MSDEAPTTAIRGDPGRSGGCVPPARFMAKGTARSGHDCAVRGPAPHRAGVQRLMRQNHLLAPPRTGAPRRPRNHDGTIIPETLGTMWGTDPTTTITGDGQAAVFVAVDHGSAACVGIHAHARAPLPGPGADPPRRVAPLRRVRQGDRPRSGGAPRSRLAVHVRSLPEGIGLSRHRQLARLCLLPGLRLPARVRAASTRASMMAADNGPSLGPRISSTRSPRPAKSPAATVSASSTRPDVTMTPSEAAKAAVRSSGSASSVLSMAIHPSRPSLSMGG